MTNDLFKLLPYSLQQDPVLKAIAQAGEIQLKQAYQEAELISNLVEIDKVPEKLLDLLAYEKHVDFYQVNAPIIQKRNIVKSSISLHRKKGTPYAIEQVLKAIELKAEVLEWWQYDVDPYHFTVELLPTGTPANLDDVRTLILHYKNKRSWFDGFVILVINNEIHFLNDSYQYPVFYETCGEFGPDAAFWRTTEQLLNVDNDSYQYSVEYEVFETHHTKLIDGEIKQHNDSYEYKVMYPTIGEMEPLEMSTHIDACETGILAGKYHYPFIYPICGEFYCEE